LRSAGARSLQSFAAPELFLGPHTSMGCLLLCMFGVGLMKSLFGGPHRHPWSLPSTFQLSYPFFTLFFLFCLHIVPVTEGVPNKQVLSSRVRTANKKRRPSGCALLKVNESILLLSSSDWRPDKRIGNFRWNIVLRDGWNTFTWHYCLQPLNQPF